MAGGEPAEDAAADAQAADAAATAAAEVALDVCLEIRRPDVLWEHVAPRFRGAGRLGALLERLLPRVLAGRLAALAPEIMQACCRPLWRSTLMCIRCWRDVKSASYYLSLLPTQTCSRYRSETSRNTCINMQDAARSAVMRM